MADPDSVLFLSSKALRISILVCVRTFMAAVSALLLAFLSALHKQVDDVDGQYQHRQIQEGFVDGGELVVYPDADDVVEG